MVVSLLLLLLMTFRRTGMKALRASLAIRIVIAVIITAIAYLLSPVTFNHTEEVRLVCQIERMLDFVVMLKCLFMLAVVVLYSQIYVLVYQRQQMLIENEQLQNENLTTRYNMLVSQINPHFFFNSLNSLAMLVRERDDERALKYIDQLSYTFRYIIQNGQSGVTTLREEMEFAKAYIYLFKIRYEDKLFFDFDIDSKYENWTLPALSLQPLIGNTVKHNSITTKNPLNVSIRVVDGVLEIENPKHPKLDVEPSTGIGLSNLSSRWEIVIGKPIEVVEDEKRFMVRLPLDEPKM
jgi:LytS/YehU family sensor histidine kinase